MKRLLPIGIQDFATIREEGFVYEEIAGRPALAIDSLEWGWKKHPVIRLDLNAGEYDEGVNALTGFIDNTLGGIARDHGLELRGELLSSRFMNLISDLHGHSGEKVAVIIDEYDKPLLNTIDDADLHVKPRTRLKSFYGVLKSSNIWPHPAKPPAGITRSSCKQRIPPAMTGSGKKLFKVGVNFDSGKRNIGEWKHTVVT